MPRTGVLRLLIPHVVVRVRRNDGQPSWSIRPDALAYFMTFICVWGAAMEPLLSRVKYPRSYSPTFVYALSAFYVTALAWEWWQSNNAVKRALSRKLP